jgi:hypothetical protein
MQKSARRATPGTKEWGRKARKVEARSLRSSSKRAAIAEARRG